MGFDWKSLVSIGATTLGTLVGGPFGPAIGGAVAAILGVDAADDKAVANAMTNATPEQKAAILKLDNDYKLEMERIRVEEEKAQLATAASSDAGQVSLMLEDAKSNDKFRSYARPAALWMSVVGVGVATVLLPIVQWVAAWQTPAIAIPIPDGNLLMFLASSLLGVGGMRTLEFIKTGKK